MQKNKFAKNLILSLLAQALSLLVSFVVGIIVPKFIPELQYSYWQVFLLYYGYVGLFHFGLTDGILLRYAQYDYEQLDKKRVRSQFILLMSGTSIITILAVTVSAILLKGEYFLVALLVSIGIVIKNYFAYTSYTFQMTNRINYYALLTIAQRLLYGVMIIACLLFKLNAFYWFCLADLASELISSFIASFFNKGLYFGKSLSLKEMLKEAGLNISAGVFLMVANLSSMLIVGGAKMVIQWRWDELVFGKLAFSFSVANLFLAFVTAISVVLFPSLKRMREEEYPLLFEKLRSVIMSVLFFVLIVYFPGRWLLNHWLPNYSESLVYLGILLPLIVFSSKNNLLTNNYLKVYRKEKLMLAVNMGAVVFGMGMFLLGAYFFNNLEFILFSLIATIMLASIVSELVVIKIIKKGNGVHFLVELLMTVAFIVCARYCSLWIGCAVYALALLIYSILYRKALAELVKPFIAKLKKKKNYD